MLWIGELSAVERACMRSVLRQGHTLTLWTYGPVQGVPDGVVKRDAAEILPESSIVRHHSGSVALFANRFRYELIRRGLGTWLDTDVYLLAPLDLERAYLMGREEADVIASSILRLPMDCRILRDLLMLFEEEIIPFWMPLSARIASRWRLLVDGRTGIERMPWGSLGPRALTAYARAYGVAGEAHRPAVFYPVNWRQADWIKSPRLGLEQMISADTVAVHLWNECIKGFKHLPAPEGSFLARLHAEGS